MTTHTLELLSIPWLPAILLALGFPLLLLLLTELINSGARRKWAITPTLRAVRNTLIPALGAMLFVTEVWQMPVDSTVVRAVKTLFWLAALYSILTLINDTIFGAAGPDSWQSRVPKLFRDLARTGVIALGAAIIYSQVWNQEISGALTALGLGSIVIGLALQEPLGNIVSGLMLLFERPLNIGDWVVADGTTGRVIEINWRSVHIETLLHELRIIPNVRLYKESFSNLSRPTDERTDTYDIGFSYDHPPNVAKAALLEMLLATPGVLRTPAPQVHTLNYGDFSIIYRLYFTVAREEARLQVRDEILSRIWYVARREGLEIPFPIAMRYHPGQSTSAAEATVGEVLSHFPRYRQVLEAMQSDAEGLSDPAAHGQQVVFAAGEEMLPLGSTEQGFVLITSGQAQLLAPDGEGHEVVIAVVESGDFYGEASMSAGQPSAFRVVAVTDVRAVEFDSMLMARSLHHSSGLAAELGEAIEHRRQAAAELRRKKKPADLLAHSREADHMPRQG